MSHSARSEGRHCICKNIHRAMIPFVWPYQTQALVSCSHQVRTGAVAQFLSRTELEWKCLVDLFKGLQATHCQHGICAFSWVAVAIGRHHACPCVYDLKPEQDLSNTGLVEFFVDQERTWPWRVDRDRRSRKDASHYDPASRRQNFQAHR